MSKSWSADVCQPKVQRHEVWGMRQRAADTRRDNFVKIFGSQQIFVLTQDSGRDTYITVQLLLSTGFLKSEHLR